MQLMTDCTFSLQMLNIHLRGQEVPACNAGKLRHVLLVCSCVRRLYQCLWQHTFACKHVRRSLHLLADETDDAHRIVTTVLELAGQDQPGLLADVTHLLTTNGCDVRSAAVRGSCLPGPECP